MAQTKERHREYMKEYLSDPTNYAKHRARTRKNKEKYKKAAKLIIAEFRKNGCAVCGEPSHSCLDAHHLYPDKKELALGEACQGGWSSKRVREELKKCACLCKNCHCKLHAGEIEFDAGRLLAAN